MTGRYLAIVIGCLECRNPSWVVGLYATQQEAAAALDDDLKRSGQYDHAIIDLENLDKPIGEYAEVYAKLDKEES